MVRIQVDDQGGEQAMEDHRDNNGSVDGTFDEAQYKRPSVFWS